MVEQDGGKVRIEIVPWLTQHFGHKGSARLVIETDVERETPMFDLLTSLTVKYPAFGEVIVNLDAGELHDHVVLVYNEEIISPTTALAQAIKGGDTLTFVPAYRGG